MDYEPKPINKVFVDDEHGESVLQLVYNENVEVFHISELDLLNAYEMQTIVGRGIGKSQLIARNAAAAARQMKFDIFVKPLRAQLRRSISAGARKELAAEIAYYVGEFK